MAILENSDRRVNEADQAKHREHKQYKESRGTGRDKPHPAFSASLGRVKCINASSVPNDAA